MRARFLSGRSWRVLAVALATPLVLSSLAGASPSAPRAEDDFATTIAGVRVDLNVLDNDVDPDGGELALITFNLVDILWTVPPGPGGEQGSDRNGDVYLKPGPGAVGWMRFRSTAMDEEGEVDHAWVTFIVRETPTPTIEGSGAVPAPGGRVSFALAGAPSANGITGSLSISRSAKLPLFASSAIVELAGSGPNARMTGVGSWLGKSGFSFELDLVEKGEPGGSKGDRFALTIRDASGATVFSTDAAITSGNVAVR